MVSNETSANLLKTDILYVSLGNAVVQRYPFSVFNTFTLLSIFILFSSSQSRFSNNHQCEFVQGRNGQVMPDDVFDNNITKTDVDLSVELSGYYSI